MPQRLRDPCDRHAGHDRNHRLLAPESSLRRGAQCLRTPAASPRRSRSDASTTCVRSVGRATPYVAAAGGAAVVVRLPRRRHRRPRRPLSSVALSIASPMNPQPMSPIFTPLPDRAWSPNMARPTRTSVDPSSTATSKSSVIPIDSSRSPRPSRSSRSRRNTGRILGIIDARRHRHQSQSSSSGIACHALARARARLPAPRRLRRLAGRHSLRSAPAPAAARRADRLGEALRINAVEYIKGPIAAGPCSSADARRGASSARP